jgi:hypothetical protein
MDILDKINSLTDDQLRMVAERDDVTGVLAAYRLAELRGLPAPERSVAVIGEGYVIVARDGKIERIETEGVAKIIRQEGDEYCVYSEDGSRSFGCYPSRDQAEERLREIHYFDTEKEVIREGSFVSWNASGGRARGQVEHVMTEGVLGIPESDFKINAEPDNPAVLIRIWRERAEGWQPTETLVGHKMSTLTRIEPLAKESYKPPKGAQEAAQRALDWIAEGHAGSGFTDVGRARAAQLARGGNVSRETIGRMASFFARHQQNQQTEGFNYGEDGFPSGGRVAWDAWGGDAGRRWAESIMAREEKQTCPTATRYPEVNAANQEVARVEAMYGPTDIEEPGEYWVEVAEEWDIPLEDAVKRKCGNCAAFDQSSSMLDCIEGDATDVGYCKIWDFVCSEQRTCLSWSDAETMKSITSQQMFVRKAEERRFTLGPLYVPDFMDAHGEWTDADELQTAVWGWVRSGDRRIFLQHDRDVEAGEWVEVMTMPQPWTVEMRDANGKNVGEVTYPPNTVFLGVVWNEETWPDVKAGKIRGYSIGGYSDRMYADLPENGERDGVEMDPEPVLELKSAIPDMAGAVAYAVAEALKQSQPVVNVVMPDPKVKSRKIERDENGNIARIVEEED